MPFLRPTLSELRDRAFADIEAHLPGADARVRRSNLNVLAIVNAGASHLLHGHMTWIAAQILPDTAETTYLERWATIFGLSRKAATNASGIVTFTGQSDVVVPTGTELRTSDGLSVLTTANLTLVAGTGTVAVEVVESGDVGNLLDGTRLTLWTPQIGVSSSVTVTTALSGGAPEESDDALRGRLLQRLQAPPQGGAVTDYEQWALQVAGVRRVWIRPGWLGLGTVGVFALADDWESPIPSEELLNDVQSHLDALRPVAAHVVVLPPEAYPIDLTLSISPDSTELREAIELEIQDLFWREGELGGQVLRSHLTETISGVAGEVDHTLILPAGNVTLAEYQWPVLGSVVWQ